MFIVKPGQRIGKHTHCVHEINAMLGQITPCLRIIPLEFVIHATHAAASAGVKLSSIRIFAIIALIFLTVPIPRSQLKSSLICANLGDENHSSDNRQARNRPKARIQIFHLHTIANPILCHKSNLQHVAREVFALREFLEAVVHVGGVDDHGFTGVLGCIERNIL